LPTDVAFAFHSHIMIGTYVAVSAGGIAAGALHVLAGPDHLAAMAPLAADSRRSPWRAGALWAVGHSSGVLAVGVLALLLRDVLPIERLSSVSERLVGVALVGVGLWGLRRVFRMRVHAHPHVHGGAVHTHVHVHDAASRHRPDGVAGPPHRHAHASLSFGILHGLAGSSHLFGVLPALALPTPAASVAYLAAYATGTVVAMTTFSSLMGGLASRARRSGPQVHRALLGACSGAAIVVGSLWLLV
jgi:hypothetical protein